MAPSYPEKIHIVTITVGKHAEEEEQMYPQRSMVSQALRVALLVTLVALAVCACGGGQEEANKPRPLPEDEKALRPGQYRSEEFRPSLSFRVGKGWINAPPEASDVLAIRRAHEMGGVGFADIREVYNYKLTKKGPQYVVEAPKDLVGWFQQHPYLQTSKPEPVTVGGVKGVQFDVVVEDLPEDYSGVCGPDCVALFRLSTGIPVSQVEADKVRLTVLEDVKGETVIIGFVSLATEFDEFAPEAQKVLDSVKWRGS
jgi:hypothetical protein